MIGTYYRLSLADEDVGTDKTESNSIQGQRGLVEGYIMARPELATELRQEYVDDGYSGTSTSRPAFQRLIQDAQDGKVKTIIVKDFSRFARDYIEAGDVMNLSQNVVETFIDRIEVFNDKRVKIRFTFEDALNSYEEK